MCSFVPWLSAYNIFTGNWKKQWNKLLSRFWLFVTPWSPCQVPLSMKFSRQEYWNGSPCLSPGDLPDSGIEHGSPALQASSLPSEPSRKPSMVTMYYLVIHLESCSWLNFVVLIPSHWWVSFSFTEVVEILIKSFFWLFYSTIYLSV